MGVPPMACAPARSRRSREEASCGQQLFSRNELREQDRRLAAACVFAEVILVDYGCELVGWAPPTVFAGMVSGAHSTRKDHFAIASRRCASNADVPASWAGSPCYFGRSMRRG